MAPLDWAIVAVMLISALAAFSRGFLLELVSLVGLVAGIVVAGLKYTRVAEYIEGWGVTPIAAQAIAFLLIAFAVMLLASLLGRLLRGSIRTIGLGGVDRFLGVLFGLLRGAVVVVVLVMALAAFFPETQWASGSKLAPYFISASDNAAAVVPETLRSRIRRGCEEFRRLYIIHGFGGWKSGPMGATEETNSKQPANDRFNVRQV